MSPSRSTFNFALSVFTLTSLVMAGEFSLAHAQVTFRGNNKSLRPPGYLIPTSPNSQAAFLSMGGLNSGIGGIGGVGGLNGLGSLSAFGALTSPFGGISNPMTTGGFGTGLNSPFGNGLGSSLGGINGAFGTTATGTSPFAGSLTSAASTLLYSNSNYLGYYGVQGPVPLLSGAGPNGVAGTGSSSAFGNLGSPFGAGGIGGIGSPFGVGGIGSPYGVGGIGSPYGGIGSPYGVGGLGSPYGGIGSPYGAGLGGFPGVGGFGGIPSVGGFGGFGGLPGLGGGFGGILP